MIKKKNIIFYFLILFSLSSYYFYAPVFVNFQFLKLLFWLLLVVVFVLSYHQFLLTRPKESRFFNPLKLLIFLILFSLVPAYIFWGQSMILSLRSTFNYLSFILFFFLLKFKPSIKQIEKIIWVLAITYIVCYIFSLLKAPTVVFGNTEKGIDMQRGIARLFIPGRSFVYLAYFLALAKYLEYKKKSWLFLGVVLFLIIVIHVIRQYILFSFLIGFYIVFKEMKWWKKMSFVAFILITVSYIYTKLPILQTLVKITEGQLTASSSGAEDIRMTSYRYFFTEFSPNVFTTLFGNGVPHSISGYGSFYINHLNYNGIYMSDVGYAQIFALFGLIGLFLFLIIFYKALIQKNIPVHLKYTQWYILFIVLSNILSGIVLNSSTIITIVFVLYILEIIYLDKFKLKKTVNVI